MQGLEHGPRAVEGQHHLPPRRAEEVVLEDPRAPQAPRLDLRQVQAVVDVVVDQLLRPKSCPAGRAKPSAPAR